MLKCIIFDLDGTLVDSETLSNQAFIDIIPEITAPRASLEHWFRGRKLKCIFAEIEQRFDCTLPDDIEPRYRQRVTELMESELRAFDGVHKALDKIKQPVCIASSAPLQKIKQALSLTDLNRYFGNHLCSSYQINSWKPEPDIYLHAARTMSVDPECCLAIEDSEVGLEAAQKAHMEVAHFSNGSSPLARRHFDSYDQLESIIESLETP